MFISPSLPNGCVFLGRVLCKIFIGTPPLSLSLSLCVCVNASWRMRERKKNTRYEKNMKLRKRAKRWHFNQSINRFHFNVNSNVTQHVSTWILYPFFFSLSILLLMLFHEVTLPRSNSISKINQIILLLKMYILSIHMLYVWFIYCMVFFSSSARSRVHHCLYNPHRLIKECIRSNRKVRAQKPTHSFLRLIAI